MNYRKVAFILLLPFLLEPLVGCHEDDETDYTNHFYRELTHCGLTVYGIDNREASPEVANAVNIDYEFVEEAFGLSLWVRREESTDFCSSLFPGNFSFLSKAYALGPLHRNMFHYTLMDQIEKIEVKSVDAFGSDLPAGSDVTHLFAFREGFNYYSESEYVELLPSEFSVEGDGGRTLKIQLYLMEPQGYSNNFQFDIAIHLTDGRVIETRSEEFYVE
ncbi:DUF5034 domain-containing protein [Halocola ammonii]